MGDTRMGDDWQRRICDGVTGAGVAAALAGLALGHWRGFVICAAVVVTAQVIRADV